MNQTWNFYTPKELKPSGWLRRQLEIQAAGLSGNLDKIWPDVRDSAWIGGNAEAWERAPYWLDGFIPLAYLLEDDDLISRAKKYMDYIIASQREDGWICPIHPDDIPRYDTWVVQLISKVLVVYYHCSGDDRIPDVLYKVLKNYYHLLSTGKVHLLDWGKYRWFEAFPAINFIYDRYQEEWLVELARLLKTQGMDFHTLIPLWKRPLNKWTLDTHIVNLVMMLKSECVSCDILGEKYTDQAEYFRTLLDSYNGTAVGLFTGDECLSGLSPIQGSELCSVAEQMYSYELLYAYTGDSKWAERLEVLAFNALPAAISDDMWTHQYLQMSNQICCEKFPNRPVFRTNGPDSHLFGLEPNFGCCTANFNQAWPKFALSAFLYQENEVFSAILVPSTLTTEDFSVTLNTNYPFENTFTYQIEAKKDFIFTVRIPSFAKNITVDGRHIEKTDKLSFSIAAGTSRNLQISFETTAHLVDRPNQLKTAAYGSLVFSLPISYEKKMYEYEKDGVERKFPYCDYEYLPTSDWNYGYADEKLEIQLRQISDIPFSSILPPIVLKANVQKIDWGFEDGFETVCAKIPESQIPTEAAKEMFFYPYGCAKLRMTELPLLK